ncbi:MAG: phenylalanyl-tRNA synthetase, alpha subunit [Candidatus Xenolissoclinum pacificiensis L6]|uniref:Phenylalanine--tRNA ligase alpha subunit n=1 Tax=Candidatus Xenolissoclinum pacificiensis L6 TaxID=1401685 RepID=W2V1H2_9RICK|nr:MAG: phenylalanyl-tRNA synthetase, alpha subunit [Candidatus Xenolissoclinum pacificiensis L6]
MFNEKTLKECKEDFLRDLSFVCSKSDLNDLRSCYIGKKGKVNRHFEFARGNREFLGEINTTIAEIKSLLHSKMQDIKSASVQSKLEKESIDCSLPSRPLLFGGRHPLVIVANEIITIMNSMGFSSVSGPEVESDFYVFSALNVPSTHPARDVQDTFYLSDGRVLRPHTSSVQVRCMEKMGSNPKNFPIKICSFGRTYRNDDDPTHTPMFHQIEAMMIGEKVSLANLKATIVFLLKTFFMKQGMQYRFRPNYFPFTEPSIEVDIKIHGKWMEVLGCGIINSKVLDNLGISTTKYSGFAFGLGVERFAMIKYNIPDIRDMYSCNIPWLSHYSEMCRRLDR